MPRNAWKDTYYVTIFCLSQEGLKRNQIAGALGIDARTLKTWLRTRPAVKDAFKRGRAAGGIGGQTFGEYVYNKLPPAIKKIWDELESYRKVKNGEKRVEAFLSKQGKKIRQMMWAHALIRSNFNASEACRKVGISYECYEKWKQKDPYFIKLIDEISWHQDNYIEGGLMGLIAQGDPTATKFAAQSRLRHRGFGETMTIEHKHSGTVAITLEGVMNKMSLDGQRELVKAIKQLKEEDETPALEAHKEDVEDAEYTVKEKVKQKG